MMSDPRAVAGRRQSHGTIFTRRSAVRNNCRRCYAALRDPVDRCWICGLTLAGVRWPRLLFQVAVVIVPALLLLYAWTLA